MNARDVVQQAADLLLAHGVATYILVCRDPDSQSMLVTTSGDPIWRLGAIRLADDDILEEFICASDTASDGGS